MSNELWEWLEQVRDERNQAQVALQNGDDGPMRLWALRHGHVLIAKCEELTCADRAMSYWPELGVKLERGEIGVSDELRGWLEEIRARRESAFAMVSSLCQPRGTQGSREWIMSIPARPDYDPDLVIGAALGDVDALVAKIEELVAACDWFLREIQTNGWADGAEILRRFQSALRVPGGGERE